MLSRLRDNLLLKIISLIASILLWCYVQAERPPNVSRTVFAKVVTLNEPLGVDIRNIPQQTPVTINGPLPSVERVKDLDITATADLRGITAARSGLVAVRVTLTLPDSAHGISFDPPAPIKVLVNPEQQSQMTVMAQYPKEPPAGFHYARPVVHPAFVTLRGLPEQLNQVERVVVNAAPPEPGANIDGDFPVLALDKDKNVVPDVKMDPDKVHVKVELVEEPAAKIVTVSPSIVDQPQPPHLLKAVSVKPNQVKITGRPERLNQLFTLPTEDIFTRNLTKDEQIEANLLIGPDLAAYTLDGKRITSVTVSITLGKVGPATATPSSSPPLDTNTDTTHP